MGKMSPRKFTSLPSCGFAAQLMVSPIPSNHEFLGFFFYNYLSAVHLLGSFLCLKFNIAVVYSFTQKDTSDMKIVALKYLPLLLSSLGSYSFHLINNILPGLLSCGEGVQVEIAKTIGSLACVLTENTVIKKLRNELPFHKSISSSITFLCPDCDSIIQNKAGNKLKWFLV